MNLSRFRCLKIGPSRTSEIILITGPFLWSRESLEKPEIEQCFQVILQWDVLDNTIDLYNKVKWWEDSGCLILVRMPMPVSTKVSAAVCFQPFLNLCTWDYSRWFFICRPLVNFEVTRLSWHYAVFCNTEIFDSLYWQQHYCAKFSSTDCVDGLLVQNSSQINWLKAMFKTF